MFAGKRLVDLTEEDFAKHERELLELGRKQMQAEQEQQHRQHATAPPPGTLSADELAKRIAGQGAGEGPKPLSAEEYRQQQEQGGLARNSENRPPSYEEFLAMYYPQVLQRDKEAAQQAALANAASVLSSTMRETEASEDALSRGVLQELERCQMPAVPEPGSDNGQLVKTIEHYTFADSEECVHLSIVFDKDLWMGASKHLADADAQVQVTCKSTSLDIQLRDLPVSERAPDVRPIWRLQLSPLFSRVEPSLTTWKVRNGKLSVKLSKSKAGGWKKAVKY